MLVVIPTTKVSAWLVSYVKYLVDGGIQCLILLDNPDPAEVLICEKNYLPNRVYRQNHEPYVEDFVLEYCAELPANWILRLDSDEWISVRHLKELDSRVEGFEKGFSYGIKRTWLKIDYKTNQSFSLKQVNDELGQDFQYRIFHNAISTPLYKCHTPGICALDYLPIIDSYQIVHLIWILRDRNSRSADQKRYSIYADKDKNLFRNTYVPEEVKRQKWIYEPVDDIEELTQLLKLSDLPNEMRM